MRLLKKVLLLLLSIFIVFASLSDLSKLLNRWGSELSQIVHGSTQRLVRQTRIQQDALYVMAKCILPDDAVVGVLPSTHWQVAAKYHLYPAKLLPPAEAGQLAGYTHILSIDGSGAEIYKGMERQEISGSAAIYYKKGETLKSSSCETFESATRVQALFSFLLTTLLSAAIGICLLSLLGISAEAGSLWFLATSTLTGMIVTGFAEWAEYLMGVPYSSSSIYITSLLMLAAIFTATFRQNRVRLLQNISLLATIQKMSRWQMLAATIGGMVMLFAMIEPLYLPPTGWDAMAMWMLMAKGIAANSYLNEAISYPILWSMILAKQFALGGNIPFDEHIQWTLALFTGMMGVMIYTATRLVGGGYISQLTALLIYIATFHNHIFYEAYADMPLALFTVAAVIPIFMYIKGENKIAAFRLALLLLAGVSAIKLEGGISAVAFAAALFFVYAGTKLTTKGRWHCLLLMLPATIAPLWIEYLKFYKYIQDVPQMIGVSGGSSSILVRAGEIIYANIDAVVRLFYGNSSTPLLLIVMFALPLFMKYKKRDMFLSLFIFAMSLFTFFISMLGWTDGMVQQYYESVVYRLFAHIAPLFILLAVVRYMGLLKSTFCKESKNCNEESKHG